MVIFGAVLLTLSQEIRTTANIATILKSLFIATVLIIYATNVVKTINILQLFPIFAI
jgi:hypothetical protein